MPIGNTGVVRSLAISVALLAGGCDAVLGLDGDPGPCATRSFETATPTDITPADDFSISRDRSFLVLERDGTPYELTLPGGTPTAIDLGVYPATSLALAPEGNALFYTASIEPPLLLGAVRSSASWNLDATVPRATYVGTPSAAEYGPRRLIARLRMGTSELQEYEDDDGIWTALGDPHTTIDVPFAPNLTPTGLTIVYVDTDPDTGIMGAVFQASRESRSDWFGEPVLVLPGTHRAPQLLAMCRELYVVDDDQVLRRYDLP